MKNSEALFLDVFGGNMTLKISPVSDIDSAIDGIHLLLQEMQLARHRGDLPKAGSTSYLIDKLFRLDPERCLDPSFRQNVKEIVVNSECRTFGDLEMLVPKNMSTDKIKKLFVAVEPADYSAVNKCNEARSHRLFEKAQKDRIQQSLDEVYSRWHPNMHFAPITNPSLLRRSIRKFRTFMDSIKLWWRL